MVTLVQQEDDDDSDISSHASTTLTQEQLKALCSGSLAAMQKLQGQYAQVPTQDMLVHLAMKYMSYLVTATLALGLAPRSQILRELRVGETFSKEARDGKYWARLPASLSKNKKPVLLTLPDALTPHFDFFLQLVRPAYLERSRLPASIAPHSYVFFQYNGQGPRKDFSSLTQTVALELIGRKVTAHEFRSAVITTFYDSGATQAQMDTLASLMAHDPTTARQFYYRPQFARAAAATNDVMARVLLGAPQQG